MDLMQMSQRQNQCVKTQFWRRRGSGYKWQKIRNNNYRDLKTSSQRKRRKRVSVNARQILTLLYLMFLKQFNNTLPSLSLYTQIWFLYFLFLQTTPNSPSSYMTGTTSREIRSPCPVMWPVPPPSVCPGSRTRSWSLTESEWRPHLVRMELLPLSSPPPRHMMMVYTNAQPGTRLENLQHMPE